MFTFFYKVSCLFTGSTSSSSNPGVPVVFIRRPTSLLKSPSADSESSDPIKPLMIKTDSTSSSSFDHRRGRLMAERFVYIFKREWGSTSASRHITYFSILFLLA